MKGSDIVTNAIQTPDATTGVTVLLVDDSKTIRRSASNFLSNAGYTVVTAVDGFEALSKVVEHRPALIFADIMMPRLDGYQTCALIKNNADYRNIPIVMLSSKDGLFDKARARVVGSDAHLSKPFTAESLKAAVEEHLGASQELLSADACKTAATETTGV
ncbi:MAG: twitching motility two-component system response regulator PilG [Granulosicoccus sp.]|jgi:twitching motility two-component system response regulator PilG